MQERSLHPGWSKISRQLRSLWGVANSAKSRQRIHLAHKTFVNCPKEIIKNAKHVTGFRTCTRYCSTGSAVADPPAYREPLDAQTLSTIRSPFGKLMELANRHDLKALHEIFWQSPSALLVAKAATPSEPALRNPSRRGQTVPSGT